MQRALSEALPDRRELCFALPPVAAGAAALPQLARPAAWRASRGSHVGREVLDCYPLALRVQQQHVFDDRYGGVHNLRHFGCCGALRGALGCLNTQMQGGGASGARRSTKLVCCKLGSALGQGWWGAAVPAVGLVA